MGPCRLMRRTSQTAVGPAGEADGETSFAVVAVDGESWNTMQGRLPGTYNLNVTVEQR